MSDERPPEIPAAHDGDPIITWLEKALPAAAETGEPAASWVIHALLKRRLVELEKRLESRGVPPYRRGDHARPGRGI